MADIVFPGAPVSGKIGTEVQPAIVDLELYQGDDFEFELNVNDANGSPQSLTGWSGRAFFKRNFTDSTPIEATVTLVNSNLAFKVALDYTQTRTMAGDYIYDVELITPNGKRRTYLAGDVKVNPEVSN